MSTIHSATKYEVNPKFHVCTNPKCPEGLPHYKGFGKPNRRRCAFCGSREHGVTLDHEPLTPRR